ncbi:MAG: phosphate propanoyltransferase, partial [Clostridia bacterium]|nr:phosphate propanoyltransferase [Clostridia bacterium]
SLADGERYGVKDGDYVTVDATGTRRTRFYDVQVRVNEAFRLEMHLDTDDANAVGLSNGSKVKLIKE